MGKSGREFRNGGDKQDHQRGRSDKRKWIDAKEQPTQGRFGVENYKPQRKAA